MNISNPPVKHDTIFIKTSGEISTNLLYPGRLIGKWIFENNPIENNQNLGIPYSEARFWAHLKTNDITKNASMLYEWSIDDINYFGGNGPSNNQLTYDTRSYSRGIDNETTGLNSTVIYLRVILFTGGAGGIAICKNVNFYMPLILFSNTTWSQVFP